MKTGPNPIVKTNVVYKIMPRRQPSIGVVLLGIFSVFLIVVQLKPNFMEEQQLAVVETTLVAPKEENDEGNGIEKKFIDFAVAGMYILLDEKSTRILCLVMID